MEDYNDIIDYLKPHRDIKASDKLRNKVRKTLENNLQQPTKKDLLFEGKRRDLLFKRFTFYGTVATVVLVLAVSLSILLWTPTQENGSGNTVAISQSECIVFAKGEIISGDEALAIANMNLDKMNSFEKKVQQHVADEHKKMNNFINKTENQK